MIAPLREPGTISWDIPSRRRRIPMATSSSHAVFVGFFIAYSNPNCLAFRTELPNLMHLSFVLPAHPAPLSESTHRARRNGRPNTKKSPSPLLSYMNACANDDGRNDVLQPERGHQQRQERTIQIKSNGQEAVLISRAVPILPDWDVTVWEWKDSAKTVNEFWEAESRQIMAGDGFSSSSSSSGSTQRRQQLDPFGLVCWPGSLKAAQELHRNAEMAVRNRSVVILGAGVGVEAQAAAILGAKSVVATDIHPTTLQQLQYGVDQEDRIVKKDVVQCQLLDLFATRQDQPLPYPCELLVVADVLYNDELASQVCRRCAEAMEQNPDVRILITDSQRFVPTFVGDLNRALETGWARTATSSHPGTHSNATKSPLPVAWQLDTLMRFTGSGVIIEEDQTYDVQVQTLWVGLP